MVHLHLGLRISGALSTVVLLYTAVCSTQQCGTLHCCNLDLHWCVYSTLYSQHSECTRYVIVKEQPFCMFSLSTRTHTHTHTRARLSVQVAKGNCVDIKCDATSQAVLKSDFATGRLAGPASSEDYFMAACYTVRCTKQVLGEPGPR